MHTRYVFKFDETMQGGYAGQTSYAVVSVPFEQADLLVTPRDYWHHWEKDKMGTIVKVTVEVTEP